MNGGTSFCTVLFSILFSVDASSSNDVINAIFVTFDPKMSPKVIPTLSVYTENTATLISGVEVAMETMMIPAAS